MKMRIQNNALRLRLSRPEVELFRETGRVSAGISFGPGNSLAYTLKRDSALPHVRVAFSGQEIIVNVPASIASDWTSGDQTGFTAAQPTEGGEPLEIIIEKDFQCLHKGDEQRDPTAYPNPLAMA